MVLVVVVELVVLSAGGGASCVTVVPVMFFESLDIVTLLVLAVDWVWLSSAQPVKAIKPREATEATRKFFMKKV